MTDNTSLYAEEPADEKQPKAKASKTATEPTMLGRLKEAIQKKVERPVVRLEVPERPGVSLRISPNITQNQLKNWRKACGEDSKNGLDATKFSCFVIGHTTVGICIDGEEVFDEDGYALNFASPDVLEMTDATKPVPDAVRAFFGVDPHLEAGALAILDAAGYSDTVDTVDPTMESSAN
jgi:hypothetical protein